MAIVFPEELDSFLNPLSTDSVAIVSHAAQHSDTNDAIEALEAKVGKDNSTDTSSLDYKVNALNTALSNKLDSNYVTIGNTLLEGISGQTYGLIGTSEYLDVKNTNGYNKEIELDITAVESKLTVDGFALQTDISSAITALDLPNTYDAKGAADTALSDANEYTDFAVSSLGNNLPNIYVPISSVGSIDGVASLGPDGKVPSSELNISETIQDVAAEMITGATHTNISVSYDAIAGRLSLTALGGGGGGASVVISSTPPTTPGLGDIWLDSDNGRTYIWDGAYWIEVGGSSSQAIAALNSIPPSSPVLGSIWMNSSTAKTYIYDGSFWAQT